MGNRLHVVLDIYMTYIPKVAIHSYFLNGLDNNKNREIIRRIRYSYNIYITIDS